MCEFYYHIKYHIPRPVS